MKTITITILLVTLFSCSEKKNKVMDKQNIEIVNKSNDGLKKQKNDSVNTPRREPIITKYDPRDVQFGSDERTKQNIEGIPPDGTYIYDIAYAEWQGKSMGEKVKVVIRGNTIKIISEGNPSMTAKKGDILDEGQLIKHNVTGEWLITNNPLDANLDVYGGCVGAPMVVDFVLKKYHTC